MSDISNLLPKYLPTVDAIYSIYKKRGDAKQERNYLGMSEVAGPCERALWYKFRKCCITNFSGRLYRLFETGDLEEARFVKDLRDIGCEVYDRDEKGEQFSFSLIGGHLSGHMDGCARLLPEAPQTFHVLEFKTSNDKLFQKLKKDGVEKAKPQHLGQMMLYMMASSMTRALYLVKNKDNEEIYAERVRFDKLKADALMARSERIITSTTPPERISNREDYYECSYCDAKKICWGSGEPALPIHAINCRQCCHSTARLDGKASWTCEKHNRGLSESDQSKACDDHLVLPGLISFAEPEYISYGGEEAIKFRNQDGKEWIHGNGYGAFTTQELMEIPQSILNNSITREVKEVFGATVTNCCNNILARYPEADCEIVWRGPIHLLVENWYLNYKENLAGITSILRVDDPEFNAAEFSDGRLVIAWKKLEFGQKVAEIRKSKE